MQLTSDVSLSTQEDFKLLTEENFIALRFFSYFYIYDTQTESEKNEAQTYFQNFFIKIFTSDSLQNFISDLEKGSSKSDTELEEAGLSRELISFFHNYALYINEIRKPNPDSVKCKELANKLHFGIDFFVSNGFFPLNSPEIKQLYDRIQQDASVAESEILQLENKKYADAVDPQLSISHKHLIALRLISYYETETDKKPSAKEMELMQDFLKSAQGDMKLNAALRKMADIGDEKLNERGLSRSSINHVAYYIYKTRRISVFNSALERLFRNYQNDQQGISTTEQDKISLAEYGSVCDVASLDSIMQFWERKGFLSDDNDLLKLRANAEKASSVTEALENKFGNTLQQNTVPGKIVLNKMHKENIFLGLCNSFLMKFAEKFITKHRHTSKLFTSDQAGLQLSHVDGEALESRFSMSEYLYSDVYRIKIESLIPKEQQDKLRMALGEDWLKKVYGMYGKIERDIHDGTISRFSHLTTPLHKNRDKRLMFSWLPFGLGNKKFSKNDFEQIHTQVRGEFYQKGTHEMLCSEFVAHTTIAALVELNAQLKDVVGVEAQMVRMPFGEHEDLRAMHPDRLVSVLKQAGCIEEEVRAPMVAAFFREESKGSAPQPQTEQIQQSELNKELDRVLENKDSYADAINKKLGISNKNILALRLMSYYDSHLEVKPTEQERKIIQDFLKAAKGNAQLNIALKKIVRMGEKSLNAIGLYKTELERVIAYASRTKDLDAFRFDGREREINNPFEDFSLPRYSGVREISRLDTIVPLWEAKGFLSDDADLNQLSQDVIDAKLVVQSLDREAQLVQERNGVASESVDMGDNPFADEKKLSDETKLDQKADQSADKSIGDSQPQKPALQPKRAASLETGNKVKTSGGVFGFFRSAVPKFQGSVTKEQLMNLTDKKLIAYGKELLKKIDGYMINLSDGNDKMDIKVFRDWLNKHKDDRDELRAGIETIFEYVEKIDKGLKAQQTTAKDQSFRLTL